jgi:carboxypeptidase T
MRILLTCLFCVVALHLFAQTPERYARVRINLTPTHTIADLAALGVEADHGEHRAAHTFTNEFSMSELQRIAQAGFSYVVLIDDMSRYYEEQNQKPTTSAIPKAGNCNGPTPTYTTPTRYRPGTMGGYFKYEEMLAALDSMATLYPNLISRRATISDTLLSIERRPLYWLRVSNNPNVAQANKPQVLYTALHHAREPNSLSQMIFYLWYLLENYNTNSEIKYLVDNTEMYFLPCVNPDGYIYNQTTNPNGGGLWRKNRRVNTNGSFGVDLNRNYGFQWGFDNTGSSATATSETYRGTAPFSEPETRLVQQFVRSKDFRLTLNYHTYSNDLIYPWGYINSATPDSTAFKAYGKLLTAENNYVYGYGTETVGYVTNGDSDDWMYGDTTGGKRRILSMTPEVGKASEGFWPPATSIDGNNKDNLQQNLTLARVVLNYAKATDKSPATVSTLSNIWKFDLTRYGLAGGNFTVTVAAASANVLSVTAFNGSAYTLTPFQTVSDSVRYQLSANVRNGDTLAFAITINNGLRSYIDTIKKVYYNVPPQILLRDSCNNLNNFTLSPTTARWGITTADFKSAPSSITDSPTGNYANNTNTSIVFNRAVNLTGIRKASLKYWTKWDIESNYDYAYIGVSTDSITYVPQCGNYTKAGSGNQLAGQPIYDRRQSTWVEEEINLDAYVGRKIWFRFTLVSDAGTVADGFYFDDISVNTLSTTGISTLFLDEKDFSISQNTPNPSDGYTDITLHAPEQTTQTATFIVTDLAGKNLFTQAISLVGGEQTLRCNTANLPNGLCLYYLEVNGKRTPAKKMVVVK